MSVLDELASYLATAGLGTVGTDIFKGVLPTGPNVPDVCVALFEYGGLSPERFFGSDVIAIEYPRVQIVIRGAPQDYDGPRDRAETAYRQLAQVGNETVSGTTYLTVDPIQPPFLLRRDGNGRVEVAFNCQVVKGLS